MRDDATPGMARRCRRAPKGPLLLPQREVQDFHANNIRKRLPRGGGASRERPQALAVVAARPDDAGGPSSSAADGRRRPIPSLPSGRTIGERELVVGGPRGGVGAAPAGRIGRGAARRHGPEASWSYLTIFLLQLLPLLRLRRRRLEEPQDRPRRRPERRDPLGVGHPGLDAFAAHRHVPI